MLDCYQVIDDINSLKECLPEKPYCSNNLHYGVRIKPRELALKAKYIQMNPVFERKFFTLDIDKAYELYEGAVREFQKEYGKKFFFSWQASIMPDEGRIAPPLWFVQNPSNGHAHFIYVLTTPVYTSEMAHIKPLKYLDFIIRSYIKLLEADPLYTGLISKNPFNEKAWEVFNPVPPLETCSYDLEYLAQYIPLKFYEAKPLKRPMEDIAGLGRNCYIMEHCRVWAYRERRQYWSEKSSTWFEAVLVKCDELNNFNPPLPMREVVEIAKSITKWTTKNITPQGFREWQLKNAIARWSKESMKRDGIDLLKQGLTPTEIAEMLDVTPRVVRMWRKEAGIEKDNLSELKLWELEGLSRRQWYRRHKGK